MSVLQPWTSVVVPMISSFLFLLVGVCAKLISCVCVYVCGVVYVLWYECGCYERYIVGLAPPFPSCLTEWSQYFSGVGKIKCSRE